MSPRVTRNVLQEFTRRGREGRRAMTRYLVYRLLHSLVVVIGVTIIVFLLLHHLPGGPARAILGRQGDPGGDRRVQQGSTGWTTRCPCST